MAHSVFPTLRAQRFAFEGDACLYRDHLGRRVLADAEGSGRLLVGVEAPGTGGDPSRDGVFHEGLVVATDEPGRSVLTVLRGGPEPLPEREGEAVPGGVFHGAGWVTACDGPLRVDVRREQAPPPSVETPVPFFLEARGEGLRVVPRRFAATSIDRFSIGDADALKARSFRVQNMSDVEWLDSTFADGEGRRGPVASHLNTASWTLEVPRGAYAVVLRKVYDRFHGRQRARVLLDGAAIGTWYEPEEDRRARWAVSDFGALLPEEAPREVRVSIDPVAGSPLWSVSDVEVFALVER